MKALKTRHPNRAQILIVSIALSNACSTSKSAPIAQIQNQSISSSTHSAVSTVQEKTACTLKLLDAPVISGLKLGMTVDEILALFPGSKEDPELRSALSAPPGRFGNSTFLITPSKYPSAALFREVSRLTFSLLDGRVSSFTISYNGPQWSHVDKFIEKFVEGKNLLPAAQWEPYAGMDSQMKTLTCNGFSIRIFGAGEGGNLNYVLVQDLVADDNLKERRKRAREQASPVPSN
jgi:hypothetical protein